MIGPTDVIERMAILLQTTSSCVSPFIQRAGMEAVTGNQDAVYAMMEEYKERRDMLVNGLNKIPGFKCLSPGGAFYVFPNITETGLTSEDVCEQLLEAGVVTLPGTCFGDHGTGYLRLCYAQSKANILEALERIHKWALNNRKDK
jgi:aspartate/methionine/tyrosine aminotransferase